MAAVFFYIFATIMIASACVVILARNPVHSVLFLILAFCNGAGLFLLSGAEFLALILIVVYVGAVAVLFLFVVMMLDVDFAELKQGFAKYLPMGVGVGLVVLGKVALVTALDRFQRLTIQAALSGNPDLAMDALMANPLVPSEDVAEPLLGAILSANRELLPRFFPGAAR